MLVTEQNINLIERTKKYVYLKLLHEPSGHDWFHVERVWKTAKYLQQKEGGNLLVIELAALLHNLMEHNYPIHLEEKPRLALHGMMDILQIEEPLRSDVIQVIDDSKYVGDETRPPHSIEGKILQDSNWLDALGAIGVARAFASGGSIERPIFDPGIPIRDYMDKDTYVREKKQGTSMNYLIEKGMKVAKLMNTPEAKRIAKKRVEFLEKYISEFKIEAEGKDIFG